MLIGKTLSRLFPRKVGSQRNPGRSQRSRRIESLEPRQVLAGNAVITEVMPSNDGVIADEDGEFSDWIEVFNDGDAALNLDGWYLTDDAADPQKWAFPSQTLGAGQYLVVFASNKDRAIAGAQLHTNFKLDANGEYLALYHGAVVSTEFSPFLPNIGADQSYGIDTTEASSTLIGPMAPSRYLVPTQAGDAPIDWKEPSFDDSSWTPATAPIGYDTGASEGLDPSLVGYWPLDDSGPAAATVAHDASGAGHDGNLIGGVSYDPAGGRSGGAMKFNGGTNSLINFGTDAALKPTTAITIAGWVKLNANKPDQWQIIASDWSDIGTAGSKFNYHFAVDPAEKLTLYLSNSGTDDIVLHSTDPATLRTTNGWVHVAFSVAASPDGLTPGQVRMYRDGTLISTANYAPTTLPATTEPILFGGKNFTASPAATALNGWLDDMAMWNTAVSPTDIANMAAGTSPATTSAASLVAYWPMDEGDGVPIAADSTLNANDGTLVSGSFTETTGRLVGSISLDGVDDHVAIPDSPELNPTKAITVAAWVRRTSTGTWDLIATKWNDNAATGDKFFYHFAIEFGDQLSLYMGNEGGDTFEFKTIDPGVITPADGWVHVAFTASAAGTDGAGQVKLYRNGVQVGDTATYAGNSFPVISQPMVIGDKANTGTIDTAFSGEIDDVGLWNRILSQSELATLASGQPVASISLLPNLPYGPLLQTDVQGAMFGVNATVLSRYEFNVADPDAVGGLEMQIRYEDGFVAYLNGHEVARRSAPSTVEWNSNATSVRRDDDATQTTTIPLSLAAGFLQSGANVLAIQGLNLSASDADFFLAPELVGLSTISIDPTTGGILTTPTPGGPNSPIATPGGPLVYDSAFSPALPSVADPIVVTANVAPTFKAIGAVTLHYRAMYNAEITLAMRDDGTGGDAFALDGIYTAVIPAGAAAQGEMVRWYVTSEDASAAVGRLPAIVDVEGDRRSAEYFGTVFADPSVQSQLPIFQWFLEPGTEADAQSTTRVGTRASVYYDGEFYDNVFVRLRGRLPDAYVKRSFRFEFDADHQFRFSDEIGRVRTLALNHTADDKSYVRETLAFETLRNAGVPASEAFPVRVERNGDFYSVALFVELVDELFLDRYGLDPGGALYKASDAASLASPLAGDYEKKTRLDEDFSDLSAFVAGIAPTNPNRAEYLFDRVDVASLVNLMASYVIVQDIDHFQKNFYMHYDVEGTGLWTMLPWDMDLTFGPNAILTDTINADVDGQPDVIAPTSSHPFSHASEWGWNGQWNRLVDAVIDVPAAREMFLRRLRTQMDELLQAPGTVNPSLDQRLDELFADLSADVALDKAAWGNPFGSPETLQQTINRIKTEYLAVRREHLFVDHSVNNPGFANNAGIPNAQAGFPAIAFGAFEQNPASGIQDEEYIELTNANAVAVDISGWTLVGGITHAFKAGTVIPAGGTLYVTPNVAAFRNRSTGPTGGQGLFVQGDYSGHLDNFGEMISLVAPDESIVDSFTTVFTPSDVQQFLRITELQYHPADPHDDAEFIELKNVSATETLDLTGVKIVNGPSTPFDFSTSSITSLAPGQIILVVKDMAAFQAAYPSVSASLIAGTFTGSLDNSGERVKIEDAQGSSALDFRYEDGNSPSEADWRPETDGDGFSLVIVDPLGPTTNWEIGGGWRSSSLVGGSPGADDPAIVPGDFNGDGAANRRDLVRLVGSFGRSTGATRTTGDANRDGAVTLVDLALLQSGQNASAPSPAAAPLAAAVDRGIEAATNEIDADPLVAARRTRRGAHVLQRDFVGSIIAGRPIDAKPSDALDGIARRLRRRSR